jgi:UDP-glucose 4-epimerase
MNCLVTGAAGFIGSHLSLRLLQEGFKVTGIDSFNDFYPKWIKERNIQPLQNHDKFRLTTADINDIDLNTLLKDTPYIFHLAAQAGVRTSWGENFTVYTENNISATQKLLEAAKESRVKKFIFASSSSVYGLCPELPMTETSPLLPFSPYGVSKLAAEHLCQLYFKNFGVPAISLRFFTVYGPGQRPDMAFHKFLKAATEDTSVSVFGDGRQTRDFTYISDIVDATFQCLDYGKVGEIYNVGGGNQKELKDVFPILENITGRDVKIHWEERQKGDVFHTLADIRKARKDLDYSPQTPLEEGLSQEWTWIQNLYTSRRHQQG